MEESKIIELEPEKIEKLDIAKSPTPEEIQQMLLSLKYLPGVLDWKNFQAEPPEQDRWMIIWCNFGTLSQNFFVTYRNSVGQFELPHPTKHFPVHAYAYLSIPVVEQPSQA
jgi:hypothetical protein